MDEKIKILANREEVFRFSKAKVDCQYRCPIYKCLTKFNNQGALKSHISRKHKELEDAGIEVGPSGKIKYSPHLIDSVMRLLIWQKKFAAQFTKDPERRLKEIEKVDPNQINCAAGHY